MQKLDPVFKQAWIAALRSGDYAKGIGAMYHNGKYCCLGVACRVMGVPLLYDSLGLFLPKKAPNEVWGTLPNEVWGILMNMNDLEKKSFDEIADFIEEEL